MKIVIGGIKGGTGKTTIAIHLATLLHLCGKKVLLIDADEQRSASDWANQREKADFPTISLLGKNIHHQIVKLEPSYDYIVVDSGGRDTTSQRSALSVADKFILPFKPRSFDVWTLGQVKTLIEEIQIINPKLECFYVINQADAKGNDNNDAMTIISEISCLNPNPFIIGNRKAFCNSAADGKTVFEMEKKDHKACAEMINLISIAKYTGDIQEIYTKYQINT